jgi:transposase
MEAAKLAPRESPDLATIRARATLAVARKMIIYMLAVKRRLQDWVPAEQFSRTETA